MFFKGLTALLLLVVSCNVKAQTMPIVELTPDNTIVLRDAVMPESVNDLKLQLMNLSNNVSWGSTIYLYLDTPGGSTMDGQSFINFAKALPQKITTITNFAASMGFVIVQALGERLITPNGLLMSHRAVLGLKGQINEGEFESRYNLFRQNTHDMDVMCSERIGISLESYKAKIKDEWWLNGKHAVEQKAADKVVLVKCSPEMQGTTVQSIQTFFGPILVTWHQCPLITEPLEISTKGLHPSIPPSVRAQMVDDLRKLYYDKKESAKSPPNFDWVKGVKNDKRQ